MWSNIKYIILTAQRDSLFIGLAAGILFSCYVAFFLGSTAMVESDQTSLAYVAGLCRVVLIVGLIIFIAFHIRRSFENKEIDLMIVRPISRNKFILSYWMGFAAVSFFFVLFTAVTIYLFGSPDLNGFLAWSFSLLLECWIVVSLAMTAALILRSTVIAVLLSFGFYVLARLSGFLLLIATKPGSNSIYDYSFSTISKLIPRLDFFSKSEWLIYGVKDFSDVKLFAMQAVVYIGLLVTLALIDFRKKQF
jgi:ABC-type transport system involved in multi-copper enzyme maturation permease subunit